jgi:hypothetical protein
MTSSRRLVLLSLAALAACGRRPAPEAAVAPGGSAEMRRLVSRYAGVHGIPEALLHRVVQRESGYNAAARNGPYYGLMQIMPETARTMGFRGEPDELLDAETNLRWAGAYLRGAYIVADGDMDGGRGLVRPAATTTRRRDRCLLVETGAAGPRRCGAEGRTRPLIAPSAPRARARSRRSLFRQPPREGRAAESRDGVALVRGLAELGRGQVGGRGEVGAAPDLVGDRQGQAVEEDRRGEGRGARPPDPATGAQLHPEVPPAGVALHAGAVAHQRVVAALAAGGRPRSPGYGPCRGRSPRS